MDVWFVYHANRLERCGVGWRETWRILRNGPPPADASQAVREVLQMHGALQLLHTEYTRNVSDNHHPRVPVQNVLLSEEVVLAVHGVLMDGLTSLPGRIRTGTVFTTDDHGIHWYPPAACVPDRLQRLIDWYNGQIFASVDHNNTTTPPPTEWFVRLAAVFAIRFLTIHPFTDGNGRMASLLCGYILRTVAPFYVAIDGDRRAEYIRAVIDGRDTPDVKPEPLMALLVDGLERGWLHYRGETPVRLAPSQRRSA